MLETNFETIFADFVNEHAEALSFVQVLHEIVPDGSFQLHSKNGSLIGSIPSSWHLPEKVLEELLHDLKAGSKTFSSIEVADGGWLYGLTVEKYDVLLLCKFHSDQIDFTGQPLNVNLLQNIIEHALLKQECQEMITEKQQLVRQIDTLKKQHGKLIEDNYRQYRINQEREKEYAKRLEREIADQTSELREKNIQLEKFSRMQSDFLANMSHELRTPMNAIIGFADLLSDTALDEEQSEYTGIISQSADSLLVLINDILDLAKIEAGKLDLEEAPFDLTELVKNVAAMFKIPAEEKNIALSLQIHQKLPQIVVGDSTRLKQVLVNLAGNAMKFTENGSIDIRVDYEQEPHGSEHVKFSVRDTGIGIPPERQEAIFDKFTQADGTTTRKYGGTGLGLAICEQLVGLMRGDIGLESQVDKGSTFYFTIPLSRQEGVVEANPLCPSTDKKAQPESNRGIIGKARILLVEDNPVNQRLASIIIKQQGHEFDVAEDGLEALERLSREKYEVVLMDIQMPHMDGMTATKKIRTIEADPEVICQFVGLRDRAQPIKIIGLTAHARKEDEVACLEAGMDGFLSKPIHKEKLIATLNKHLAGRQNIT